MSFGEGRCLIVVQNEDRNTGATDIKHAVAAAHAMNCKVRVLSDTTNFEQKLNEVNLLQAIADASAWFQEGQFAALILCSHGYGESISIGSSNVRLQAIFDAIEAIMLERPKVAFVNMCRATAKPGYSSSTATATAAHRTDRQLQGPRKISPGSKQCSMPLPKLNSQFST